jgi:hypothetical protein
VNKRVIVGAGKELTRKRDRKAMKIASQSASEKHRDLYMNDHYIPAFTPTKIALLSLQALHCANGRARLVQVHAQSTLLYWGVIAIAFQKQ